MPFMSMQAVKSDSGSTPSQSTVGKPVRVLPPEVVNRIAAGEVVERPASVVKELVENALDARASRVDIFAGAGGRTLRIADNGSGMTREDALLAFQNHATSKLNDSYDLDAIHTLGFRGEALASVSAVAKVTCLTRTVQDATGTKVVFDPQQGRVGEVSDTGCAVGTVMEVTELFYNTPARLKFLKRPQTELGHLEEMVEYLALSHPGVRFTLTVSDKQVLKTSGSGTLKIAVGEVLNLKKDLERLLPVKQEDPDAGYTMVGFASAPDLLKSSKRWLYLFVNGRAVRCPVLAKAVLSAYESLMPHGKFPVGVLFFNLPLDEVDVNVHPAKREVRYVSGNAVFSFVKHAIQQTLSNHGHDTFRAGMLEGGNWSAPASTDGDAVQLSAAMVPPGSAGSGMGGFSPGTYSSSGLSGGSQGGYVRRPDSGASDAAMAFYQPMTIDGDTAASSEAPKAGFRVVGQLFNTYILLETPQGLMVVDQHIASERTFFEALKQNTFAETPDRQTLLASEPLVVTPTQAALLRENGERFEALGFTYELQSTDGSGDLVVLTGVPLIYEGREPDGMFESLLVQLEETGEMTLDLDHLIATLACHSAVRAGDGLTTEEMHRVIEDWLGCTLPWTCPHGRPIAHTIQTQDLNRLFHRPGLPVNAFG
ncbi:MAG: DNA mismatch repair endonuclease MutL [Vampirovibrio sp.]|nr:DNA mismatch repair endonuclease MutL [Vampirovibrio sp.]